MVTEKRGNHVEVEAEKVIPAWLEAVRSQVESVRFGQVQIVIHDWRVVQIEKVEKIRFDQKSAG